MTRRDERRSEPTPAFPVRLARWLLRLYPRAIRHTYGQDMVAMTRRLAEQSRHERFGTMRLSGQILLDAATAVPRTHRFEKSLRPPLSPIRVPRARKEQPMATLRHDVLVAARRMRTNPGFTLIAALTLALGIGANTAIFSVVYGVLLRPLGVADADRLAALSLHRESDPADAMGLWPGHLETLRDEVEGRGGIERLGSFLFESVTLMGDGEPEELGTSLMVDGAFFKTLGVAPVLGRVLDDGDVLANQRGTVCVISESLWQRLFGGDPAIVGRVLQLDGVPVTVAGVMPANVPLPQAGIDLWMPQGWNPDDRALYGRIGALARLAPGSRSPAETMVSASTVMREAAGQLAAANPRFADYTISLRPFRDTLVGTVRPALLGAAGAVGLILLIACANMASLLLSRAVVREREMATRRALGARHHQLASQLLAESVLLASLGGALGVVLAVGLHRLLIGLADGLIPRLADVRLDLPVLGFAAGTSVLAGVLFGMVPVAFAFTRDLASAMRGSASGHGRAAGTGGIMRARQLLVIAQVAVAVVLVATAALFVRSLAELRAVDPGFEVIGTGGARIFLDNDAYANDTEELAYFDNLLERVRATPGVARAGATTGLPMDALTIDYDIPYTLPGETEDDTLRQAYFRSISPDYLETLGVPLLRGRALAASDQAETEAVAVINDTFARLAWPGHDPVGEPFAIYGGRRSLRVVGVVGDVHFHGPSEKTRPAFFVPHSQTMYGAMTIIARAADGSDATGSAIAGAVAAAALEINRAQPVHSVFTLTDLTRGAVATDRFYTRLLLAFAVVALLLAAAGIYGVVAYWVNESRREIGIRLAIGAETGSIVRLVLGRSLTTTAIGLGVGLLTVVLAGRLLNPLLFTIRATDRLALGTVIGVLGTIAFVASLVPAIRAARIDPVSSLRAE